MPNQTGPKSTSGKLASCMNNFQHGGTSITLFLTSENPQEFFALMESAFEHHQPSTDEGANLVTDSVRARWMVRRRHRAAEQTEAELYERKSDAADFTTADVNHLNVFDRYTTSAERALHRALQSLQLIQKMAHDEQRWQQQFESQKQKLAIHVERFELAKAKSTAALAAKQAQEERKKAEGPPKPEPFVSIHSRIPFNHQTLYIGYEGGITTLYETSPTNEQMRDRLVETDHVTRTYNFVGGVPPEYRHLITPDSYRSGSSTSTNQKLTYAEWTELTAKE
jgi:hypothetical protein